MKKLIINGKLVLEDSIVEKNLLIDNGHIEALLDNVIDDVEIIDAKGKYIAPGFIDIHTHGRSTFDTMNGTIEAIDQMSKAHIKTGTTSFLPTTMTQSIEANKQAVSTAYQYKGKEKGAKIIGVHLEGPFINPVYKGAQPENYIIEPTIKSYDEIVGAHQDFVKLITLAPEMNGALPFTEELVKRGVTVSLGHTAATYEQIKEAVTKGIDHSTHTFNAMTPFNHRNPGCVGAIFDSDEIYAELILDGIHVHYASAKILINQKGIDKVVLITDSMEAAGMKDGTYQLGGQPVYVKDKQARLKDGALAGSVLSMNQAVYNVINHLDIPLYEAVKMATLNPAKSIKVEGIGAIKEGYVADLIGFDEDITIEFSMVNGNVVQAFDFK